MKKIIWVMMLWVIGFSSSGATAENPTLPFSDTIRQHASRMIPSKLLDALERAIAYAFKTGAARRIAEYDLDHAHVLYDKAAKHRSLAHPDGLLLHTQELVRYAPLYALRNVFVDKAGNCSTLPCARGQSVRYLAKPDEEFCTVTSADLAMREPANITFYDVTDAPQSAVTLFESNIRCIRGRKILFVLFGTIDAAS